MKVFISSLISGIETIRNAARDAVMALGHEPAMAEDFGARPHSPQVACLDGVRQADVVVLVLGERYGATQPSGISATHEEYRKAKGRKPVLAFVQEGVSREPEQAAFVAEVQGWESGLFRAGFTDAADLQPKITRALHEWQLANAAGPLDPGELLARAIAMIPPEPRGVHTWETSLFLAIAGGPTQPVLRPVEMESEALGERAASVSPIRGAQGLRSRQGLLRTLQGPRLILQQERGVAAISIDEEGAVLLKLPIERSGREHGLSVLIQENVQRQLAAALAYAGWVLERMDPTQWLTHVVLATKLAGAGFLAWRTRAEHDASPNQVQHGFGLGNEDKPAVHLTPPHRPRASLRLDAGRLAEDLLVLLRRQWKA